MSDAVVINATSIGARHDGISAYGVHLLRALSAIEGDLRFEVFLNEAARSRLQGWTPPEWVQLRYGPAFVSPDRGSRGHMARFAYAQYIRMIRPRSVVFALSQIEATTFGPTNVFTVHDAIPLLFPKDHPRQHTFYKRFLGPCLRNASAVVTPSESTSEALQRYYGIPADKLHVIFHGPTVPVGVHPSRWTARRPYILCIARSNPNKNLAGLVQAFARIQAWVAEDLVVAGRGLDRASVMRLVKRHGARPDRIVVRPDITEEEKIRLLDGASAFVYPSLHEGFGLPPLEAMARRCPVVTSAGSSLREVYADASLTVDPRDDSSLAAALYSVLTDLDKRRQLVRLGLQRVRKFSWERSVRRHVEVLRGVMTEAART